MPNRMVLGPEELPVLISMVKETASVADSLGPEVAPETVNGNSKSGP